MTATLTVVRAGPAMTVQDLGRPGHVDQGLSTGGAADRIALLEATALLAAPRVQPAIEMAGSGGTFTCDAPLRFALTGAPMRATIDSAPIAWNATHRLRPGQELTIGGALAGSYGYLTCAGGIAEQPWLGSLSAHLAAGIGGPLKQGGSLTLGDDPAPDSPAMTLPPADRFSGGDIRLMPGPQSALFDATTTQRFFGTGFTRGAQANRQGVRLDHAGAPFASAMTGGLASDFIVSGDVQMTGDGVPYVLLGECQTIGGYPRIGTVLPQDLPRVAQAPIGATLRFVRISLEQADADIRDEATVLKDLRRAVQPRVRDPHDISDLLSYQLISGVTCGDDLERT